MSGAHDRPEREALERHWTVGKEASRTTTRIEAFSDAVIAIMLTLLAVELLQFDAAAARRDGIHSTLATAWPAYFAFGLTFLVVGQIWMTHHNLWRYISKVDQGISILNLVLLMSVAIIPFSANVLAVSFDGLSPKDQSAAAVLYSATMLSQAITFNAILWWSRWRGLLHPNVDDALYCAISRRYLIGPLVYAAALVLALISPKLGMACYVGVIFLYLWPGAGDLPPGNEPAERLS